MRFVANLRTETVAAFAAESIQPEAYLLSSHRISPSLLEAAAHVRGLGLPLFADNGTKLLIEETIDLFAERSNRIRLSVNEVRRELGQVPSASDIPEALRRDASDLAESVVAHATGLSEGVSNAALLADQLSMRPTDLIAQEDFAVACLIGLGLEREITGWSVGRFDTRNRRSLRLWRGVAEDRSCKGIRVYAVLSGIDYNTARSAGRLAAEKGVTHAAIGMAGITSDPSGTDFFVMGPARVRLDRPAPRRYVRLAQVIRGVADGYADAGKHLESFHCLGLGAPSMLPIPAAALGIGTVLTTDATSPIHDAVKDRVLYDPEHHGDRVSTLEAVSRIVRGRDWPFVSPFSKAFRDAHSHDSEQARAWWHDHDEPEIAPEHLKVPSDLTAALPYFCEADPALQILASKNHIAHNHWVLGDIAAGLTDGENRRNLALAAMESLLEGPSTVTTRGLAAARLVLARDTR